MGRRQPNRTATRGRIGRALAQRAERRREANRIGLAIEDALDVAPEDRTPEQHALLDAHPGLTEYLIDARESDPWLHSRAEDRL